ncbi:MAG: PHP domain-containing protein [Methanophagales archaeon]|nr:PHP domain-containing protein [Methanophagales archaeon]
MRLDLHIHSKYSFDSILEPKKIIKVAKKRGLDGVAITDHNTIKGSLEAKKINEDEDFLVIVGSEISTEAGDIIGLFLSEEIKSRNSIEVIEEIKEQGGIVVLPHPYRGHKLNEELIEKIDAIEVFNARSSKIENERSVKLAERYDKPVIAGSDAHFSSEIGLGISTITKKGRTEDMRKLLLNCQIDVNNTLSPLYLQSFSQLIKSIKMRKYKTIPLQFIGLIRDLVKGNG